MQSGQSVEPPERKPPPEVQGFYDERSRTISYVVFEKRGRACAVIDPVLDFDLHAGQTNEAPIDALADFIQDHRLTVEWILETHIHHDHLSGAGTLEDRLGGRHGTGKHAPRVVEALCRVYNLPLETGADAFDHLFRDDETFRIGALEASVIHTPGHTIDSVSYRIGNAVFVGDVLFMPDAGRGRCDFHGGDARTLYHSIRNLLSLPPATRLCVCHDYSPGGRSPAWEMMVADQKSANIYANDGIGEEAFVKLRNQRDCELSAPAFLLRALQVNIRGGRLPAPRAMGASFSRSRSIFQRMLSS